MDFQPLVQTVTKTLVIVLFWMVFLLRLYLAPEITLTGILFDLFLALAASGFFWILLTILVDTFLKSMVMAAKEKKVERFRGGISYHLAEPSARELAWQKEFGEAEAEELAAAKSSTGPAPIPSSAAKSAGTKGKSARP